MLIISFNFFNFAKKTITKEIIMGASVFISANGYICARMHVRVRVRARGKKNQTEMRVFLRRVANLYTLV